MYSRTYKPLLHTNQRQLELSHMQRFVEYDSPQMCFVLSFVKRKVEKLVFDKRGEIEEN